MKKRIRIMLIAFAAMFLLPCGSKVNAKAEKKQLEVESELTDWVLDEGENMLYAISKSSKSVLFINAETLELEKTLRLPGGPTDFVLDDGTLYIALNSINQIVLVDVKTRERKETLMTESDPYRIAKDGNRVFYAEYDQWCDVYAYDMETGTEKRVAHGYKPDLAVDKEKHILYVGESGSSGSDMWYYSTIDDKKLSETNYKDGYGFSYPSRKLLLDENYVYYAGRNFDSYDATRFDGQYGTSSTVVHAENGFVFTKTDIYDSETHISLGSHEKQISLAEMTDSAVFFYSDAEWKITRYEDKGTALTSDTIMTVVSGKPTTKLPETAVSEKTGEAYKALEMKYTLNDWILDEKNDTIYAISQKNQALLFINATTLDLEKTIVLKNVPKHMNQYGDTLYLSMQETSQILTVDVREREQKEVFYLPKQPVCSVTDGKKLYYSNGSYVYEYTMSTRTQKQVSGLSVSASCLLLNEEDGILYAGKNSSSGVLYYYDLNAEKTIGYTKSFYYPSSKIYFDGDQVYFAGRAFDKKDPKRILGIYDEEEEEDILLVKNGLVYTEFSIYDAKTFEYMDFHYGGGCTLFEIYDSGKAIFYSQEDMLIEQIDEEKLKFVFLDPDNGKDSELLYVEKGSLLTEPKVPVRSGYAFLGWFTYDFETDKLTSVWDFAKNKVEEDLYLVAKWKKIMAVPTGVKAIVNQDMSVTVSWGSVSQAKGYEVYRAEGKSGDYTLLTTCTSSIRSYKDTSVKQGVSYSYVVKTVGDDNGERILSEASVPAQGLVRFIGPEFTSCSSQYGSNAIQLTWDKLDLADGYQIYRATEFDGDYKLVKDTTELKYTDLSVKADHEYYYKMLAYKNDGAQKIYSEFSCRWGAAVTLGQLSKPSVQCVGTEVTIRWNKSNNVDGYELYRAVSHMGTYKLLKATTATSYKDTKLQNGVEYYYKVRTYQIKGNKKVYSDFSEDSGITIKQAQMTAVKAAAQANGTVKISWAKADKVTEYDVYVATSKNGSYSLMAQTKSLSTTDIWAKPGVTYYYKVVGRRVVEGVDVYTKNSNICSAKAILSVPGKIKASVSRKTNAYISWGAVKNASGYEVYQSTSKNGKYKKVATVKEKNTTVKGLKKGKTYYYKVRAYRMNGNKKVYSKDTKIVSVKIK